MAKGDINSPKSASGTGVPKQDQYSVMHAIMDNIGGNGIAPTGLPGMNPDQNQMGTNPVSNQFGGMNGNPPPIRTGGMGLPRMGNLSGVTSMAPTNPQDMLRRTMMSKGVYGQ